MTATLRPGLDVVWSDVADRLHQTLRRRGVTRELADDVIQETALRAMVHDVDFSDANDLFRWSVVVAKRLVVDAARRDARQTDLPADMRSTVDVAEEAVRRWWLDAVTRGLQELPAAERAAILSPESSTDRRTAVKHAVRRHRARAHLLAIAETLSLVVIWVARRLHVDRSDVPGAAIALAAGLAAITVLSTPTHPRPAGPPAGIDAPVDAPSPVGAHPKATGVLFGAVQVQPPRPRLRAMLPPPAGFDRYPAVHVSVAGPTGSADAGGRPKQDADQVLCITTTMLGRTCVTTPAEITH